MAEHGDQHCTIVCPIMWAERELIFLWLSKVSLGVGGQRSGSIPPWLRVREFKPMLCDCVIVSILVLEGLWLAGITETSAPVSRRPEKRMVDFESYIQAQQREKRLKPKVTSRGPSVEAGGLQLLFSSAPTFNLSMPWGLESKPGALCYTKQCCLKHHFSSFSDL